MAASTTSTPINWEVDSTSGLVSLPTHNMFLRATGPRRKVGTPAVVIESGLGHSSVYWTAVARHISEIARVYAYDRSGYGGSEPSPLPRTAENLAQELKQLLEAAGIQRPYVVVAHSFGGVIAREFLALDPRNIAGMVFVDANTEFSYKVRPEGLDESFGDLQEYMNFNEIVGLEERHKMTPKEWAAVNDEGTEEEQKKRAEAAQGESEAYKGSCDKLAEKQQFENKVLGNRPVSVIKGRNEQELQLVLDTAVKLGHGTDEHRSIVRQWLSSPEKELQLQEDQLKLSSRGRLVHATKSGHDVQLTEPEIIAQEVMWVLTLIEKEETDIS
jgi:pimeloyl-ACP methyl ester carboxylesterase